MAGLERPCCAISDLDNNELEWFRKMPCPELGALAALDYCERNEIPLPKWALSGVRTALCQRVSGQYSKKLGRSRETGDRLRQDMIHFARYDAVVEVREKQTELANTVAELEELPNCPRKILEEKEKLLAWTGRSLVRAYECAAMMLRDTIAFGCPQTIKRSYLEYHRICNDPSQLARFHLLHPSFIRQLGIKNNLGPQRVRKLVPLYDLTL